MRDLQVAQIRIEERREEIAARDAELRKKWRFLEKKRELLAQDWEELNARSIAL